MRAKFSQRLGMSHLKTILLASALCVVATVGFVGWHVNTLFKEPDFSSIPSYYPFKTEEMRREYYEYYDGRAQEWPVPSEGRYIETSYGKTFMRVSGPENASPLVLLPSGYASSLVWAPNISDLSKHFRTYAVDNIYDVGRSVNSRPVKDADDLSKWLDELLTSLELGDSVSLMGLSLGGWLTSQYALRFPGRLRGIVMAAPAATVFPLPGEWAWRGILGALPPHKFFMTHVMVNWMFQDLVRKTDAFSKQMLANSIDDACMAMKCYTFRMPIAPTALTDDELASISVPALFLVGENEVIYSAQAAISRLAEVAPKIRTRMIEDASHDLTISQRTEVNELAISFLQKANSGKQIARLEEDSARTQLRPTGAARH